MKYTLVGLMFFLFGITVIAFPSILNDLDISNEIAFYEPISISTSEDISPDTRLLNDLENNLNADSSYIFGLIFIAFGIVTIVFGDKFLYIKRKNRLLISLFVFCIVSVFDLFVAAVLSAPFFISLVIKLDAKINGYEKHFRLLGELASEAEKHLKIAKEEKIKLKEIEQEKNSLRAIINSDHETLRSVFKYEMIIKKKENIKSGIVGFLLGVCASLVASLIMKTFGFV